MFILKGFICTIKSYTMKIMPYLKNKFLSSYLKNKLLRSFNFFILIFCFVFFNFLYIETLLAITTGCNESVFSNEIQLKSTSLDAVAKYHEGMEFLKKQDYKNAFLALEIAAKHRHSEAQYQLALIYQEGNRDFITQNHAIAKQWFQKAALQGHIAAMFNYGIMISTNKDLLSKAYAYLFISLNAMNEKDRIKKQAFVDKIKKHMQQTTEAEAYWIIAKIYDESVPFKNKPKAYNFYKLSAQKGYSKAQLHMGYMFFSGKKLVESNYIKAIQWLTNAAENKESEALLLLSKIYFKGNKQSNVLQNFVKSYTYLYLYDYQKNIKSSRISKNISKNNEITLINSNDSVSDRTVTRINFSIQNSTNDIKERLLQELIIPNDSHLNANKEQYFNLKTKGQPFLPFINYQLGVSFLEGKLVERDYNKAIDLLVASAYHKEGLAAQKLGEIYYKGIEKKDKNKLEIKPNHFFSYIYYTVALVRLSHKKETHIIEDLEQELIENKRLKEADHILKNFQ